jgi:hypothetical protein
LQQESSLVYGGHNKSDDAMKVYKSVTIDDKHNIYEQEEEEQEEDVEEEEEEEEEERSSDKVAKMERGDEGVEIETNRR